MLSHFSRAATDQVVAPFVNQPVQDAKQKQNCKAHHFINVECISEYNRQQQKLEDFLLTFFDDILLFDYADITKENHDQ